MESANEIKRTARQAGLLYLAMSIVAMIDFFYLTRLFIVSGDAAATAHNILAQEPLYRISLLVSLATQILFILVVLTLYRLFENVDRHQARVMLGLVGAGIAAQVAGFALSAAPLVLLNGGDYLSVFSREQLEALSFAAIRVSGREHELLTAIWGLWLFPFAILTIKSGFLPKFLGVLLIVTGVTYVVTSVIAVVLPAHIAAIRPFAFPLYFGEFVVVLWLAFVGARPRAANA